MRYSIAPNDATKTGRQEEVFSTVFFNDLISRTLSIFSNVILFQNCIKITSCAMKHHN